MKLATTVACTILSTLALAAHAQLAYRQAGNASWVCGGVGSDERRDLAALRAQAKLELLFVTSGRGAYIAGAEVALYPGTGSQPVLEITSDGPTCLIDVAPGTYRVEASYGGEKRSARVTVPARATKPARAVLAFQGPPSDGITATEEEKRQAAAPD